MRGEELVREFVASLWNGVPCVIEVDGPRRSNDKRAFGYLGFSLEFAETNL